MGFCEGMESDQSAAPFLAEDLSIIVVRSVMHGGLGSTWSDNSLHSQLEAYAIILVVGAIQYYI